MRAEKGRGCDTVEEAAQAAQILYVECTGFAALRADLDHSIVELMALMMRSLADVGKGRKMVPLYWVPGIGDRVQVGVGLAESMTDIYCPLHVRNSPSRSLEHYEVHALIK